MGFATISARIDENDKNNFDSFCEAVGLNTSTAINLFVKAVIRERRIPFDIVEPDPFYSKENQAYIMKSAEEIRAGLGKPHELIEVDDD